MRLSVEVPSVVCEDCYRRVMREFMKKAKVLFAFIVLSINVVYPILLVRPFQFWKLLYHLLFISVERKREKKEKKEMIFKEAIRKNNSMI